MIRRWYVRCLSFPMRTKVQSQAEKRMGMLIEGVWEPDDAAARVGPRGEFVRTQTTFRDTISKERGAVYFPEANRYHLYVSNACPWSHRTAITVVVKGLDDVISLSSV